MVMLVSTFSYVYSLFYAHFNVNIGVVCYFVCIVMARNNLKLLMVGYSCVCV